MNLSEFNWPPVRGLSYHALFALTGLPSFLVWLLAGSDGPSPQEIKIGTYTAFVGVRGLVGLSSTGERHLTHATPEKRNSTKLHEEQEQDQTTLAPARPNIWLR